MSNSQIPPYPIRGGGKDPEPDYEKVVQEAIVQDPEIEDSPKVPAVVKDGRSKQNLRDLLHTFETATCRADAKAATLFP